MKPRQKARLSGVGSLSDIELMAIFLRTGASLDVLAVATELFKRFKSFKGIQNASEKELRDINGIGSIKALEIKALFEFTKRQTYLSLSLSSINTPKQIVTQALSLINNFNQEHFILALLDTQNKLIYLRTVYQGTRSEVLVEPKELMSIALKNDASGLYCFHNHPSGIAKPSEADILMTKRISHFCELFGIEFKGHFILCENKDYFPVGI